MNWKALLRMDVRRKLSKGEVVFVSLAVVGGVIGLFLLVIFQTGMRSDALKINPGKFYAHYIQQPIPATVKIHSVARAAIPMGGKGFIFKFEIGQKDLDELISSKHLKKADELQPMVFDAHDLGAMKKPEYYTADAEDTDSSLFSKVRMAVDRDSGFVLYLVFGQQE